MSQRPPHRANEIKTVLLGTLLRPSRFAKLDRPKEPSWRSKRPGMSALHLVNVRSLACSVCPVRERIEAHHLKSGPAARERGLGLKATDRWAVPLCWAHHLELERVTGSKGERAWFARWGIDCHELAQGLWNARGDQARMDFVLRAHQQQAIRVLSAQQMLIVDLHTGEWRRT